MKESPEAKPAASAEDVYCQSSLNEHESRRNVGKTVRVWRLVTTPDLAADVMLYGHHHVAPNVYG